MFEQLKKAVTQKLSGWVEEKQGEDFSFIDCGGSDDPNADINIYVHGYSAVETPFDLNAIKKSIGADKNHRSFLFYWKSGSVIKHIAQPKNMALAYRLVKSKSNLERISIGVQGTMELFEHFRTHQGKAEQMGNGILLQQVTSFIKEKLTQTNKVNLIGHSLGARMILNALEENESLAKELRINHVILLAGAASTEKIDWGIILKGIQGNIYNFYSSRDVVLMAKPDTEKCVGRYCIPLSNPNNGRIKNINTKLQHWSYWGELQDILKQTEVF